MSAKDFILGTKRRIDWQRALRRSGLIWRLRRGDKMSVTNPRTGHKRIFDLSSPRLDVEEIESPRDFERYYRGAMATMGWYEGKAKEFLSKLPKPGKWKAIALGSKHVWYENEDNRNQRFVLLAGWNGRPTSYHVGYYGEAGIHVLGEDQIDYAQDFNVAARQAKRMADAFFRTRSLKHEA